MNYRALFISAVILGGSFSVAQAAPSDVAAACNSGNCGTALTTELAAIDGQTAGLDALILTLGSTTPSSPEARQALADAIDQAAASYSTEPQRAQARSIATAMRNAPNDVNTAALGGAGDPDGGPSQGSNN